MQSKTETQYGVARGEKIVHPALFLDVVSAKNQVEKLNDQLEDLGLDRDIRLVEVEVKTTYGRPRAYKEPADDVEPEPAEVEAASTEA